MKLWLKYGYGNKEQLHSIMKVGKEYMYIKVLRLVKQKVDSVIRGEQYATDVNNKRCTRDAKYKP